MTAKEQGVEWGRAWLRTRQKSTNRKSSSGYYLTRRDFKVQKLKSSTATESLLLPTRSTLHSTPPCSVTQNQSPMTSWVWGWGLPGVGVSGRGRAWSIYPPTSSAPGCNRRTSTARANAVMHHSDFPSGMKGFLPQCWECCQSSAVSPCRGSCRVLPQLKNSACLRYTSFNRRIVRASQPSVPT